MANEFLHLTSLPELIEILQDNFSSTENNLSEEIPILAAENRVLAEPVLAAEDLPPFTRSAVDGYAVRAADTYGASMDNPAYLTVSGDIKIGCDVNLSLEPGQATAIPTGGELPAGADASVMIEDTERVGGELEVTGPVAPGDNIIKQGEDIGRGEILLEAGRRLKSAEIGALAGTGNTRVTVCKKLEVAVISTGDELIPPGSKRSGGKIRDINTYLLASLVKEWGGRPKMMGIVKDDPVLLTEALKEALTADLIIISGGSSVGVKDHTINVINELGEPGVFLHGLAVKPGKPTIIGKVENKPVLGLPGNPASAWMVAALTIPAIMTFLGGGTLPGKEEVYRSSVRATLNRAISSTPGRTEFIPVALDSASLNDRNWVEWEATPLFGKSNLITTLVEADGLIVIEAGQEGLAKNTEVNVISYPPVKGLLYRENDSDG
ncbi:MAG: gephyrin-like molybdotransferase Glp [Bacillota bacterium]